MDVLKAKDIIKTEFESDTGLDVLFRMSEDVETDRIQTFLDALKCLELHYEGEKEIEKDIVFQLFSMHQTLQASVGHWKVSRPKGLDKDTCWKIFKGIHDVFSS